MQDNPTLAAMVAERRVAVIGSRTFAEPHLVEAVLGALPPFTLVSGGAQGADTLAERWAQAHGFPCRIYRPDWQAHGKAAGMIRNRTIIDNCDEVITTRRVRDTTAPAQRTPAMTDITTMVAELRSVQAYETWRADAEPLFTAGEWVLAEIERCTRPGDGSYRNWFICRFSGPAEDGKGYWVERFSGKIKVAAHYCRFGEVQRLPTMKNRRPAQRKSPADLAAMGKLLGTPEQPGTLTAALLSDAEYVRRVKACYTDESPIAEHDLAAAVLAVLYEGAQGTLASAGYASWAAGQVQGG